MSASDQPAVRRAPWDERCLVIAEVAQSHDGSLGIAHAFVDAAARAGAGAVKFQTHLAAAESTPAEPWRVPFSPQDETRYDYWKRMEFSEAQWEGLAAHAADAGLLFMSSPFSVEAVELLHRVGMPVWKVASGEVGNVELLEAMIATGAARAGVVGHEPVVRARRGGGPHHGRRGGAGGAAVHQRLPDRPQPGGAQPAGRARGALRRARSASRTTPARSSPVWPRSRWGRRSSRCT